MCFDCDSLGERCPFLTPEDRETWEDRCMFQSRIAISAFGIPSCEDLVKYAEHDQCCDACQDTKEAVPPAVPQRLVIIRTGMTAANPAATANAPMTM